MLCLHFSAVDGLDRAEKTHKSQKSQNRAHFADDDLDYKGTGLPVPLPDQPRITKMTDSSLTLIWLPSIPEQPRFPVSYVVEFGKSLNGSWTVYQSGKLFILLILPLSVTLFSFQISRTPNARFLILNHSKIMTSAYGWRTSLESVIHRHQ